MGLRLVLVSCCAPCSAGAIRQLAAGQIPGVDDFVVLFFNPNIFPESEYQKRMAEQIRYCDALGVKHVELEYDHDAWRDAVRGFEAAPERGERCSLCFEYRFRRAAAWAAENGYDAISSVLGVSRHKDQAQVDAAGRAAVGAPATPRHVTDMTPPAHPGPAETCFRGWNGGGHQGVSQGGSDTIRPDMDNYSTTPIYPTYGGGYCTDVRDNASYSGDSIPAAQGCGHHGASQDGPAPIPTAQAGGGAQHRGVAKLHAVRYTQFALQQSKILKRNMTDAERLLWHYLRSRHDFSFRKQTPIGNYIVDFVCLSKKLIIELDGAQHGNAAGRTHDAARDKFLRDAGYRILRFWNDQVFNNIDMVLDAIYTALAQECPPPPAASDIKYIPIKWDEDLRIKIGRASDFYRQKYCGCEFSMRK